MMESSSKINRWSRKGVFRLQKIEPPFYGVQYSLLFPKGHPLIEPTNKAMIRLSEHGIVDKIITKYHFDNENSKKSRKLARKKLNVNHVRKLLMVWLTGTFFSFICFHIKKVWQSNNVVLNLFQLFEKMLLISILFPNTVSFQNELMFTKFIA